MHTVQYIHAVLPIPSSTIHSVVQPQLRHRHQRAHVAVGQLGSLHAGNHSLQEKKYSSKQYYFFGESLCDLQVLDVRLDGLELLLHIRGFRLGGGGGSGGGRGSFDLTCQDKNVPFGWLDGWKETLFRSVGGLKPYISHGLDHRFAELYLCLNGGVRD